MIIVVALFVLIFVQLYSYAISEWTIETNEYTHVSYATKMAALNWGILIPRYIAFLVIFFVIVGRSFANRSSALYTIVLLAFCIMHTVLVMISDGFVLTLYYSNLPIYYFLVLGYFAGKQEEIWDGIKRFIPVYAAIYLAAFLYAFISSNIKYGWVIYQNSSLMTYFSNAFWLIGLMVYIRISENKTGILLYLLPVLLLLGAVVIRSRSWAIQSFLLLIITVIGAIWSNRHGSFKFVKVIFIIGVLVLIAVIILTTILGVFLQSIFDKGTKDSRSSQYIEIFSQTAWYKWILGQGMRATYMSSVYGAYSSIDNQFVYMSFHYGAIFALLYFGPYLVSLVKTFKARKNSAAILFGCVFILLWLMSVNGLSVFNGINLDVKSLLMPLFAGHAYMMSKEKSESEESEMTAE